LAASPEGEGLRENNRRKKKTGIGNTVSPGLSVKKGTEIQQTERGRRVTDTGRKRVLKFTAREGQNWALRLIIREI